MEIVIEIGQLALHANEAKCNRPACTCIRFPHTATKTELLCSGESRFAIPTVTVTYRQGPWPQNKYSTIFFIIVTPGVRLYRSQRLH